MTTEIKVLSAATESIILELARFLLQNEMTHKEFAALSRWAFARAGAEILEERKQFSTNRLMDITGLSRSEIARADADSPADMAKPEQAWTEAMRGLHKWHTRPEFLDERGDPRVLNLNDAEIFGELFEITDPKDQKQMLLNLIDADSVTEISAGCWRPETRYYIPKNKVLVFHYFGRAVSRLISTLNRNINNSQVDTWVERMVSSVDLRSDARPLFTRVSKEQALRFVEGLDDWVASNERESTQTEQLDHSRVGLGVYYFEE